MSSCFSFAASLRTCTGHRRIDWLYPGLVGASLGVAVTWVTDVTVRYYSVAGCLAILVGLIVSAANDHTPPGRRARTSGLWHHPGSMMRIVLATTARERGGVWRHMTDVAAGLRERGHEVEIELVRTASLLREDADARGFSLREVPFRRAPDVWHLHLADTYCRASFRSLLSARRSGAVVVVTEHLPRTNASDPSARQGRRYVPTRSLGSENGVQTVRILPL